VTELPSITSRADAGAPGSSDRLAAVLLGRTPLGAVVRWVAGIRASVYAKLLGAFLLVVVLFFAMGGLSLETIVRMSRHDELLHEAQRRVDWSRQIQHALAMQLNSTGMALILRDEAAIASVLRENNRFNSLLANLEGAAVPEERATFQSIRTAQEVVMTTVADIANLIRDGRVEDATALQRGQGYPLYQEIERLVQDLVTTETARMQRARESAAASNRRAFWLVGAFLTASIVLALLLGFVVSWSFILPVREAHAFLGRVAIGDFGSTIRVANRDEFGELANRMNRMSRELESLYDEQSRAAAELQRLNERLAQASQAKSDFLASMSHELRTPLNAIIGFSEVLSERMFGELNEKQDEYLKDIYSSGTHLLFLINDILDLSKIEAGRMELELTDFDLPQAIDNALTLVRERAGRRGIALHQSVEEYLGEIKGDERKVKQVLLNLLSNALKFTPEGGRVEVLARVVDGMAEISVTDTGVGIAPEDQEAIFEEFRQVGTAEKKAEGTGLGLTLCRKFIELHGGRIWVKSQVGAGSTFFFTVPLHADGRAKA
jgi:signal transduction histidine kinase